MLQTTIDPEALKSFMEKAIAADRDEMKNIASGLEVFVGDADPVDEEAEFLRDHVNSVFKEVGERFDDALEGVLADPSLAIEKCNEAHGLLAILQGVLKGFGFSWDHFAAPLVNSRISDLEVAQRYKNTVEELISDSTQSDNELLQSSGKEALDYCHQAIAKLEKLLTENSSSLRVEALLDLDNCAAFLNEAYTYRR
ncbi:MULTISPECIES: hypothetical protein [Agrobacterium]|uniref:hypothetical protein n=1 Tax=Agrobacterium TaxID=357 RepID=UPI000DD0C6D5|nr:MULTISPECIES: hypothetical protein [Agrobacterium]MDA5636570.1 hypothetical protein [Agrobacterium sp. ST15.13.013]MDA6998708.1 hypothetical protein [Agrobacterium salinitolerans]